MNAITRTLIPGRYRLQPIFRRKGVDRATLNAPDNRLRGDAVRNVRVDDHLAGEPRAMRIDLAVRATSHSVNTPFGPLSVKPSFLLFPISEMEPNPEGDQQYETNWADFEVAVETSVTVEGSVLTIGDVVVDLARDVDFTVHGDTPLTVRHGHAALAAFGRPTVSEGTIAYLPITTGTEAALVNLGEDPVATMLLTQVRDAVQGKQARIVVSVAVDAPAPRSPCGKFIEDMGRDAIVLGGGDPLLDILGHPRLVLHTPQVKAALAANDDPVAKRILHIVETTPAGIESTLLWDYYPKAA